jgi:hypothetical protein
LSHLITLHNKYQAFKIVEVPIKLHTCMTIANMVYPPWWNIYWVSYKLLNIHNIPLLILLVPQMQGQFSNFRLFQLNLVGWFESHWICRHMSIQLSTSTNLSGLITRRNLVLFSLPKFTKFLVKQDKID